MLSTNRATNYWTRNALARVRFLQKGTRKKEVSKSVRSDKVIAMRRPNTVAETFNKVRQNYLIEHWPLP